MKKTQSKVYHVIGKVFSLLVVTLLLITMMPLSDTNANKVKDKSEMQPIDLGLAIADKKAIAVPQSVFKEISEPEDELGTEGLTDETEVSIGSSDRGSISGLLWDDGDGTESTDWDGIYNGNEKGIEGFYAYLYYSSDWDSFFNLPSSDQTEENYPEPICARRTNSEGKYIFNDLEAGEYIVGIASDTVDNITYFLPIQLTSHNKFVIHGNMSPAFAFTSVISLADKEVVEDINGGLRQQSISSGLLGTGPIANSISGFLWTDGNGMKSTDWNGLYDSGELPVFGFPVALVDAGNLTSVIATTTTDIDGRYIFKDLEPGNYVVRLVSGKVGGKEYLLPMKITSQSVFAINWDLSDDEPPYTSRAYTKVLALSEGESIEGINAGLRFPMGFVPSTLRTVNTWNDFVLAVADTTVTVIDLQSNIIRAANGGGVTYSNMGTLARSLTINGNGFTIDCYTTGTNGSSITLDRSVPAGTFIRLNDVKILKTGGNSFLDTNANAQNPATNWRIEVNNVTSGTANAQRGLVSVSDASVFVYGTASSLHVETTGIRHFDVKNFEMTAGSKMFLGTAVVTAGTSDSSIVINNGLFTLRPDSELTINNRGTSTADTAAGSHGIFGGVSAMLLEARSNLTITSCYIAYRTNIRNSLTMRDGAVFYAKSWLGAAGTTSGTPNSAIALCATFDDAVGVPATILLDGKGTELNIETNSTRQANLGACMRVQGDGSTFTVTNDAKINGYARAGTVIQIQSQGSVFTVSNGAEINLVQDADNGYALGAALRFRIRGTQTFIINGGKVTITKKSGPTPAVRLYGGNNEIYVTGGGLFKVFNQGNGTANNGGADTGNQGIYFTNAGTSTNDGFYVSGENSAVDITALFGPALNAATSNNGSFTVEASNGAIFIASGRTSSANSGAVSAMSTVCPFRFTLDNPLYFDIRNNSTADLSNGFTGAPAVFTNANGADAAKSFFKLDNSDMSVWQRAQTAKKWTNHEGTPTKSWTLFSFNIRGQYLGYIASTDLPQSIYGTYGFYNNVPIYTSPTNVQVNANPSSGTYLGTERYSRLSANNAKAIIDELRIPTDADKSLFGHSSVPEALTGLRDAWTDEVYVTVQVKDPSGNPIQIKDMYGNYGFTAEWVTEGMDPKNEDGISVYGETARGGIFTVPYLPLDPIHEYVNNTNPDGVGGFIPEGYTFEVLSAYRSSMGSITQQIANLPVGGTPRAHISDYNKDIKDVLIANQGTHVVTAIDITPPLPTAVDADIVSGKYEFMEWITSFSGVSSETTGVTVSYSVNGTMVRTDGTAGAPLVTANVASDGTWTLTVPSHISLEIGNIVQIFLTDAAGNTNPVTDTDFHDALKATNDEFRAGPLVYVNQKFKTKVTISKGVAGGFAQKDKEWTFTVYFTEGSTPLAAGTTFDYTGGIVAGSGATAPTDGTLTLASGGTATFILKHGQTITIAKAQRDFNIRIVETTDTNYDTAFTDSEGASGTNDTGLRLVGAFETGRIFAFTNERKASDLTITKKVEGKYADKTKTFTFTVSFTEGSDPMEELSEFTCIGDSIIIGYDPAGNTTLVLDEFGKATFTLKHGQSLTIKNVPSGVKVVIEEADESGYNTSYIDSRGAATPVNDRTTSSITIDATARKFDFTNARKEIPTTKIGRDSSGQVIGMISLGIVFVGFILVLYIRKVNSKRKERWNSLGDYIVVRK